MIELTPDAQTRLDAYFDELRRVLASSPSVDATEVERDIHDHIDAALAGESAPIDAAQLGNVLRTLGDPSQWLPSDEGFWFRLSRSEWLTRGRRAIVGAGRQLAGGPESFRLAYASLAVLAVG